MKINIIDTPGHADFGGEVERGLSMVDGVLLLVDASEGPLPQTRFVLRKALEAKLPVILRGQQGRPPRRPHRRGRRTRWRSCSSTSRPTVEQLDFPIVYCVSREGRGLGRPTGRRCRPARRRRPSSRCSTCSSSTSRRRATTPRRRCRRSSPTSTRRPYLGPHRARPHPSTVALRKGQQVAWCRTDGTIERAKITELFITEELERVAADEVGPGEIIAIAGIPEITIGETLADPDDPAAAAGDPHRRAVACR